LLEKAEPKAVGFVVTRLLVFKGGGYYASLIGVEGSAVKIIANAAAEKYRSFKNTGLFKRLEKLNPFAKFNLFARFKKKP